MKNKQNIPVIVAEIKNELSNLKKLVQKLSNQKGLLENEDRLESAALRLHNFYTGCERIFKLIASDVNDYIPESRDWRKRLLTQMSLEVEDIRPPVISEKIKNELEEPLAFRHLVRNIYGYELDPARVERLVKLTDAVFPKIAKEINKFVEYLMQLYKSS